MSMTLECPRCQLVWLAGTWACHRCGATLVPPQKKPDKA